MVDCLFVFYGGYDTVRAKQVPLAVHEKEG